MAWRNQGITGSNNIPLGKRRFGGEEEDSRTATPASAVGDQRGRSPVRGTFSYFPFLLSYSVY
jgi:splicing factor 1